MVLAAICALRPCITPSGNTGSHPQVNLFLEGCKVNFSCNALRKEKVLRLSGSQGGQKLLPVRFCKLPRAFTNSFVCHNSVTKAETHPDVVDTMKKPLPGSRPITPEVEAFLSSVCDTTSIAEVKLKLSGFELHVKRNLPEKEIMAAHSPATNKLSDSNGSVTSLALVTSNSSALSTDGAEDKASNEGLAILKSRKVGYFRTYRTIKGKRTPPSCKEKQEVKEGQIICYIEQLGQEIPVESDVSGEIVKILRTDDEPVGYGDALISILPSFSGINKL